MDSCLCRNYEWILDTIVKNTPDTKDRKHLVLEYRIPSKDKVSR
jgi:hypothetical protein